MYGISLYTMYVNFVCDNCFCILAKSMLNSVVDMNKVCYFVILPVLFVMLYNSNMMRA